MVQDFQKKDLQLTEYCKFTFPKALLSGDSESHLQICHYLKSKHGFSTLDFSTATQRQTQSELDSDLAKYLLNTASLRDSSRLNSISTSHAGAWLRAIPNPNLGLSCLLMSLLLQYGSGWESRCFLLLRHLSLCSCGQHIDTFGDHLLGCGFGLERTRRHNALAKVIFQALVVENRDVMRKMRCNGSTESRPGDVFHPDFLEGRPAYFDVTVSNSL